MRSRIIWWLILAVGCAFGQNGPTLVGAGYGFPPPLVAPGQVVSLQVVGLKTVLSPSFLRASSVPLPVILGGISVTVNQSIQQSIMGTPVEVSYKAPIFWLNQVDLCSTFGTADCLVTFITLQIPYELSTNLTGAPIISNDECNQRRGR